MASHWCVNEDPPATERLNEAKVREATPAMSYAQDAFNRASRALTFDSTLLHEQITRMLTRFCVARFPLTVSSVLAAVLVLALSNASVAEVAGPTRLLPPASPVPAADPRALATDPPMTVAPVAAGAALHPVGPAALMDAEDEIPRPPALHGDILGEMRDYYTWTNDTLLDIARGEELGLINLMSANPGVDPWLPGKGTRLILPTAHILPDAARTGIVINVAELRLYLFAADGAVWSFPIGVGRDGFTTPLGKTKVVRKKENPTWYPTAAKRAEDPEVPAVVPPGPDNPMGEFAIYLGWPTYAVHGTNQPWAVGRRVTRGCIRLYPEDIAWVFGQTPVGTPVTVVDQPVKLGRMGGEIYIEVHPSLRQVDQIEENGRADVDPLPDQTDSIRAFAAVDEPRLDWAAIDRAMTERRGYPVRITKPAVASALSPWPGPAPTPATTPTAGPARSSDAVSATAGVR